MKLLSKYTFWIFFLVLVGANIVVFMSGISLSNQINNFESQVKILKQDNMNLEKKMYALDSLNYASKKAVQLGFAKKSTPVYLDNLKYAFKP